MSTKHQSRAKNWVTGLFVPVALILMEASWLYAWLLWVGQWQTLDWQRTPLGLGSILFLLGFSLFSTRAVVNAGWPLRRVQFLIVAGGLLAIFLVIRFEYGFGVGLFSGQWFVHMGRLLLTIFTQAHPLVLALLAGAYLWWRGIILGRAPHSSHTIFVSFLIGIGAFIPLLFIWAFNSVTGAAGEIISPPVPWLLLFFFSSLVVMALTNLADVWRRLTPEETARHSYRRWLYILLGVVTIILLVSLGVASLFSPGFLEFITRLPGILLDLFEKVLYYILLPFGYLAEGLYYVGLFLVNLFRRLFPSPTADKPETAGEPILPPPGEAKYLPETLVVALKWALFFIAAAIVVYLLARAISRFRLSRQSKGDEWSHESVWDWQDFKAELKDMFLKLWRFFRRRAQKVISMAQTLSPGTVRETPGSLDIREIYRRLLMYTSQLGMARHRYETPYEYSQRLGDELPESMPPLAELTEIYVGVRYGDLGASERHLLWANRLWQSLRSLLTEPRGGDGRRR